MNWCLMMILELGNYVDWVMFCSYRYAYPPPDGNILTNIVNALIAVPRFYTQVLHLMNKMNIPAPFRMALPTPPLPPAALVPPPPPPPPRISEKSPLAEQYSSSETEMESSDEEFDDKALYEASGAVKPRRKRGKREAIVGPAADKDIVHEAVGLKPAPLVPKEIPVIKKKNHMPQIKIAPKATQNEHKDDNIATESEDPDKEGLDQRPYATAEEIESKRLAPEEILSLPKFKNYTVGKPAPVLYIKNLDKEVVFDDFFYIFGSLFGSVDAAKSGLSIKLMQISVLSEIGYCSDSSCTVVPEDYVLAYFFELLREESGAKLSELAHQALCWLLSAFIK
ncbi:hypothetical protein POTOM_058041 [Populus tomentosa]|uniref:Uncharacterized protein n=1 Tax=Populus tomentosa TaxID=118781 RepID=A0A8X8C2J7_POPTO|nr:hypothetical protein POTOM_058041 [Populus tomentosa]